MGAPSELQQSDHVNMVSTHRSFLVTSSSSEMSCEVAGGMTASGGGRVGGAAKADNVGTGGAGALFRPPTPSLLPVDDR